MEEPSTGLHPADAEPLLGVLERLKTSGNSLFVVEHDMDVVRRWLDVTPDEDQDAHLDVEVADVTSASRSLETLRDVGLGYLRLGQPATELSGGEAQRIKIATELQRARRGHTLYLLDEPTAGLHPSDVALLMRQLHALVDAGNTVVVVEHDLDAISSADWVIDLGPGGGESGGKVVAIGTPADVAANTRSVTAPYLARRLRSRAAPAISCC